MTARSGTISDGMPQLGWTARADGFIDHYNRGWYDYTGTTPEQMQGWGWRSVHDPLVLPRVEAEWRRCIESGEHFEMQFPLRRHDGDFRTFLTRVTPIRGADGKVSRWVGINTDIEEVRAAHALRDEMRAQGRDVTEVLLQCGQQRTARRRVSASWKPSLGGALAATMSSADLLPPSSIHRLALEKMSRILGDRRAERLLESCLGHGRRLDTPEQLYELAAMLSAMDGIESAVGALLSTKAVMLGASPKP